MSSILTIIGVLLFFQVIVIQVLSRTGFRGVAYFLSLIGTWLTFPGIILRELSHKLLCNLAGVPVHEAKYFMLKYPCGYVLHAKVSRYRDAFLLTVGPFVVNSVFAVAMFILPCFGVNSIVYIVLMWLGISFAANAFPSDGDAQGLLRQSKRASLQSPIASLGLPMVVIIAAAQRIKSYIRVSVLYAAILYSVTFCLLAAVLIAGSAIFPDAYAVKVISAAPDNTPGISPGNTNTGSSPLPTIPKPTAIKTVAGREAPAKDWLPVAQEAMESRNSNAILINVEGRSNDHGVNLPINGKCHWWRYIYASQAEDLVYDVIVHDGVLESVKTRVLSKTSVEKIEFSYGDPTIPSWNVDSVEAAATSNAKLKELTGLDAPASAAYSLELSCWDRLTWTVYNYDARTRVIADISIDQETGEISNAWVNPNS